MGVWIQTYMGRKFWPLQPSADDICIEDIAHVLAMKCRFTGHCLKFYSIAEHSIHVSKLVNQDGGPASLSAMQWGLLHDAAEAYLPDVARPVKPWLPHFRRLEDLVLGQIAKKFHLSMPIPSDVKEADTMMLAIERRQAMKEGPAWGRLPRVTRDLKLRFWPPEKAEEQFLKRYQELWF